MSDEQKATEPEDQKKMANDGDDVEAHHKPTFPKDSAPSDDDGDDVEAHFKGGKL